MSEPRIEIILVDDHAIVTDGIQALVATDASLYIKGVACNGKEALEMIALLKVDVVIMDIDMPVMNGTEAAEIMKKTFPDLKVIMLSMHDEKAVIGKLKNIGVDGYLLKNASKAELVEAIHTVANGGTHFSEEVTAVLLQADGKPSSPELAELTEREIEIIRLIAEGLSNKEIGDKLFISHRTVDTHRTNLMAKLGLHNVAGIVRFAIQQGLMDTP
jgi:two-component system, NarL family, nitrate/nitrite response regulator NarL